MLTKGLTKWFQNVQKAYVPTNADRLLVGNFFKERILDRTARGLDCEGHPFAPYNDKRPYYWNPYTGSKKGNVAAQSRSVSRMVKKLGGSTKTGVIRGVNGKALGHRSGTGTSIKFASYAAFKQALGRGNVDLTGPRAPHMLQRLQVKLGGPGQVILGIWGEAAARANAHNNGNPAKGLPKRKFMGVTQDDRKQAMNLLAAQGRARVKAKLWDK